MGFGGILGLVPATGTVATKPSVSDDFLHKVECRACPLNRATGLRHPKMPATGDRQPTVYIIGEAPGRVEDERGRQFTGDSGDLLRPHIREYINEIRFNNTIRCFVGETEVIPLGGVNKGFKRWYQGVTITAFTKNGRKLTGTPNHPILTKRGWIPLGLLKNTDELFCYRKPVKSIMGENPDIYNGPTRIDKLYNSFLPTGNVSRVIGSASNFYGEVPEYDVDVVAIPSELVNSDVSAFSQFLYDLNFKTPGHPFCSLFSEGDESGVVGAEPGADCSCIDGMGRVPDISRFTLSSYFDAIFGEKPLDSTRTDVFNFSKFFGAISEFVEFDNITEIVSSNFAGHVYTLETTE